MMLGGAIAIECVVGREGGDVVQTVAAAIGDDMADGCCCWML